MDLIAGPGQRNCSPDGSRIAFIRESGADTSIVVVKRDGTLAGEIDLPAIDLDPEFTRDGKFLV
jgi:TolB protein